MNVEQLEDMSDFLEDTGKQRLFLKYLKQFDWIIQEKAEKMQKYVSGPELQTDAVFAIEETFKKATWLMEYKKCSSEWVDLVVLFKGFFLKISRQNKRDNMPLSLEERQGFY